MKRSNRTCVAGLPRNVPSRNTGERSALFDTGQHADVVSSRTSRIPLAYPLVSLLASQGIYFSIAHPPLPLFQNIVISIYFFFRSRCNYSLPFFHGILFLSILSLSFVVIVIHRIVFDRTVFVFRMYFLL
jgi:hypothetical protein